MLLRMFVGVGSMPDASPLPQNEQDSGTSDVQTRAEPPRSTSLRPQQVIIGIRGFVRSRIHNFWMSSARKAAFEEWSGVFGSLVSQLEGALNPTQKANIALALLWLLDDMYKQEDMAWEQNWPPQAGLAPLAAPAGVDYLFVRAVLGRCDRDFVLILTYRALHFQAKALPEYVVEQSGVS